MEAYPNSFSQWLRETRWGLLGLLVVGMVLLLALALLPAVQGVVITDKLMAGYNFDTGSGTNLTDASPNNNHGLIIGGPAWGTGAGCLSGSCLNFTAASGQYVTIPSSSTLQGLYNFTIIGWVKFNEVSITQTILAKDNASSQRTYEITVDASNNWNFQYWDTSGTVGDTIAAVPGGTNTSQGVCFAMTRDVSLGTNNLKTYFNAVLASQATKTNNQMALSPATNLTIGRRGDGGQHVNASIDRVWIFNRTLSVAEMTTLCAAAAVDTTPPTVTVASPTNTTYGSTSVWVNVTLNEDTGNVTAQLDGSTNSSLTNSSGNWNVQLTGLGEGAHNVRVFANDSNGNMNSSQIVYFTVDTGAPVITIGSPTNTTYNTTTGNITLNTTANEAISVWQYSLNDAANVTFTPNITFIAPHGANKMIINANDTAGNKGAATIYFTVNISVITNITLYDEVTEATVIGTSKWTLVTLKNTSNLATNSTYNATNGTALFVDINNTAWVIEAGSTGSDFPYPRTVVLDANVLAKNVYVIPSGADAVLVTFVLNDLTGAFTGATMKIKKYTSLGLVDISQRAFDIEQKHSAYLLRGDGYLLYIDNGAEERSLGIFVPDATATKTITLGNVSLAPLFHQAWKDVIISVNWTNASNGTGTIGFLWNDTLNQTEGIEWFVYNGTNESQQIFYAGSNASVFFSIFTGINNTNISYLVRWRGVHTRYGVIEGRQLSTFFNMQFRVKLGALATERWHYLVAAMILVIGLAGLFDARSAATGGMVVVGAILLLNFWGWMQTAGIVISTLAIIALIGKLKEGRQ